MKKRFLPIAAALLLTAGCSVSSTPSGDDTKAETPAKWVLDSKHQPLPPEFKQLSAKTQETYVMAAQDPEALAAVPCYCGCYESDGHTSNLDCFVDKMGPNKEVLAWDLMGTG